MIEKYIPIGVPSDVVERSATCIVVALESLQCFLYLNASTDQYLLEF